MAVSLASVSSMNGGAFSVKLVRVSTGAVQSRLFRFENVASCFVSQLKFFLYSFPVRWYRGAAI